VSAPLTVSESILTGYLHAGIGHLTVPGSTGASPRFFVIETARIAAMPEYSVHPDVGISMRDRGVVAMMSPVRPDELDRPTIRVWTSGPTAELLARATVAQYFGFRPERWVDSADNAAEAVIVDEVAAIGPLESGHREDLVRAWFVLTGLPFVSHVLAVGPDADPDEVATVADWFESSGALDRDQRRAVRERIAAESGASLDEVATLLTGLRWTMGVDERRAVAELFSRSGVAGQVGPVRWYLNEDTPRS
jgi:hypothetical protein